MVVKCGSCSKEIDMPDGVTVGASLKCPHCNEVVDVARGKGIYIKSQFLTACPSCRNVFEVDEKFNGVDQDCPECGHRFTITRYQQRKNVDSKPSRIALSSIGGRNKTSNGAGQMPADAPVRIPLPPGLSGGMFSTTSSEQKIARQPPERLNRIEDLAEEQGREKPPESFAVYTSAAIAAAKKPHEEAGADETQPSDMQGLRYQRSILRAERGNWPNRLIIGALSTAVACLVFFLLKVACSDYRSTIANENQIPEQGEKLNEIGVAAVNESDPQEEEARKKEKLSAAYNRIMAEVDEVRTACAQTRNVMREDAERFQRALNELSSQNHFRAGTAAAEGRRRLGSAEYAMMIARADLVNELYTRYSGGKLKAGIEDFKSGLFSFLNNTSMDMSDRIAAVERKADSFVQTIVKSVNDGISNRENEVWEAEKFVRKLHSTAKQSEAMLRIGSLSEMERLLATIDEDKWRGVREKLKSMPMAPIAISYGDVGPDEFIVQDDPHPAVGNDKSETDVRENGVANVGHQEDSASVVDTEQRKKVQTEHENVPGVIDIKPTSKPDVRSHVAEKPKAPRRRTKCKSPEQCTNFAESGQNFCEEHRCQSYGCKQHRATLTIPSWFDVGKYDRVTGNSIKRDFRKLRIRYCKRHMCQRTVIQPNDRKTGSRGGVYLNDYDGIRLGAEFFFCTNERMAKGKYCSEHACKVPTCNAPKWEYWVEASAEELTHDEFRSELPRSLFEFRGLRLKRAETCKGHSAMDPDAIRERNESELQTEGDQRKARESAD